MELPDHVGPETAARMKATGFMQPDWTPGQFWLDSHGRTQVVIGDYLYDMDEPGLRFPTAAARKLDFIYLASASDILRELGSSYALTQPNKIVGDDAYCMQLMPAGISTVRVHLEWNHHNEAEACALAWEAKPKRS